MFSRQVRFKIYHFICRYLLRCVLSYPLLPIVPIKLFLVICRSPIFHVLFHTAGYSKQAYKTSKSHVMYGDMSFASESRKLNIKLTWNISANILLISPLLYSCLIINIFLFLFGLKEYAFGCVVTYFFYNNRALLLIEQTIYLIGSRITTIY